MFENYEVYGASVDIKKDKGWIENLEDEVIEVEGEKIITFEFVHSDFVYYLFTYSLKGKWYPYKVEHSNDEGVPCEFCGSKSHWGDCEYLNKRVDELFEFVINSETFRFKALTEFPKK